MFAVKQQTNLIYMKKLFTRLQVISLSVLAAGCLGSCSDEDEPSYKTSHPDKGAVVITTDWTDALAENTIPDTYCLCLNETVKHVEGATNCYPDLLPPGKHALLIYNEPQGITIDATTASVDLLEDETLEPMPGYLFSAMKELDVKADDTLRVSIPMERRLCPVTLKLSLVGDNAADISHIEALLNGIAASVDLQSGMPGNENLSVKPVIRQLASKTGSYTSGELEMACRIVGVTPGESQLLTITLQMKDGHTSTTVSDLTDYLNRVNSEQIPVVLESDLTIPKDAGISATLSEWIRKDENIEIEYKK